MLDEIKNQLKALLPYLEADLARARSTADLEEIRVAFLGKKRATHSNLEILCLP